MNHQVSKPKAHHHPTLIMSCGFVLTAVHLDPQIAWDAIRAAEYEIRRIEALISSWKEDSQTSRINKCSGMQAVSVDQELFDLIERSLKMSHLTCGAFDISGTLARYYWNFNKSDSVWLKQDKIEELRFLINYHNIELDHSKRSVYLANKGMKIGFGGIGKGYAAQRAKSIMMDHDILDGMINASGDLLCWGNPPDSLDWKINIPDPRNRQLNLLEVSVDSGSVVTSGCYESYTIIEGQRYSHIINPQTGTPVTHTKNVSVVSPDAEFGDAIATALSVLPIDEGLGLVNQLKGVECIIIDAEDNAHFSEQLKSQAYA